MAAKFAYVVCTTEGEPVQVCTTEPYAHYFIEHAASKYDEYSADWDAGVSEEDMAEVWGEDGLDPSEYTHLHVRKIHLSGPD